MRLSKRLLLQSLPDDESLVLVDQGTTEEIVLDQLEARNLMAGLQYFIKRD